MRIDLDLKLKKGIKVAAVKGSVDVHVIGEFVTKRFVKQRLINAIRENGFVGTVHVDDEVIDFGDTE